MKHTTEFPSHNVLGHYCFDCGIKTRSGLPGWPKSGRGAFVSRSVWASNEHGGFCRGIVWANGNENKRDNPCSQCGKYCGNPVESSFISGQDSYREIRKSSVR